MNQILKDEGIENRIENEAIVDAYDEQERAMGWYYYMAYKLFFPIKAKCIAKRGPSPLQVGEAIEIQKLASEEECMREIMVEIIWQGRQFAVPLAQLEAIVEVEEETEEALGDWHYWVARGYQY